MSNRLPFQYLPESLQQLAELCGTETMWLLWDNYGGTRFRVPKTLPDDHFLSELLGEVLAKQLCNSYGGELLTIPVAKTARDSARNALIRYERANGKTPAQLARQFKLTDRAILNICSQQSQAKQQVDLFATD